MLRLVFLFSILMSSLSYSYAQNARGILRIVNVPGEIRTGEAYDFELTIIPFKETALTPSLLEDKVFLDFFYITKVEEISQSKNNYEATIVKIQAVVTKIFRPRNVYIWTLGDRNIPVEIRNITFKSDSPDSKTARKDFTIYQSGEKFIPSSLLIIVLCVLGALLLLGLLIWVYCKKKKRGLLTRESLNLKSLLRGAKTHKDFELIYLHKADFLGSFDDEEVKKSFINFLDLYRIDQFATNWKDRDLSDLIVAKERVLKGGNFGS